MDFPLAEGFLGYLIEEALLGLPLAGVLKLQQPFVVVVGNVESTQ